MAAVDPRMTTAIVAINGAIIVAVTAAEEVVIRGRPPQRASTTVIDPMMEVAITWTVVFISITSIMPIIRRGHRQCIPVLEHDQTQLHEEA